MGDERRCGKTHSDETMIMAMRLDEREDSDEVIGRWHENLVQGA